MADNLWIGGAVVGPVQTNCYILRNGADGKEAVLIDPGDSGDYLVSLLREMGAAPVAILLTHGHFDHILGVNAVKAAYPACPVYIAEAERPMVENRELNCNFFTGEYTLTPDHYLTDGEELPLIGRTFRVLASPGHTAGSVCYYSAEDKALFAGDTIFLESHGRTDLPTGDDRTIRESLRRLLTTLPGGTEVFPGHGGETTVEHERIIEGFDL